MRGIDIVRAVKESGGDPGSVKAALVDVPDDDLEAVLAVGWRAEIARPIRHELTRRRLEGRAW